jgi:hydroxyacylglutathione hydrolase
VRTKLLVAFCVFGAPAIQGSEPDGAGLNPGTLPAAWMTGGFNCVTVPDWQVHEYNDDFYILRESGCIHYQKPFLYLIFGEQKAVLEDTGAGAVQTAPFVMDLLAKWARTKKPAPVKLIVVHSHGHDDHTAGDKQFQTMPDVQFIAPRPAEIQKAAGIARWPADIGGIDPGGRVGERLVDFICNRPVAHVPGTHIEQTNTPYLGYLPGTAYQRSEHSLAFTPRMSLN